MKGDEIVGIFRNEAVLESTLKRLEAAEKPAPVNFFARSSSVFNTLTMQVFHHKKQGSEAHGKRQEQQKEV